MSRYKQPSGPAYMDGVYIGNLGAYRHKFKQIGKNVMVIVRPSSLTITALLKDPRQIRDLAKSKGLSATLGDVLSEVMKTEYRKPTFDELVEFRMAKEKAEKYVQEKKLKLEKQKQDALDAENLSMLKRLEKNGVLTSKGQVRVPIDCRSDALRRKVVEFYSARQAAITKEN